jgi:hypothetical protein
MNYKQLRNKVLKLEKEGLSNLEIWDKLFVGKKKLEEI